MKYIECGICHFPVKELMSAHLEKYHPKTYEQLVASTLSRRKK
jgi:hypothetical protein